jgi:hypothetical protein
MVNLIYPAVLGSVLYAGVQSESKSPLTYPGNRQFKSKAAGCKLAKGVAIMGDVIGVLSGSVAIVGGLFAAYRYFRAKAEAKILVPPPGTENIGRKLTVSGIVANRRRSSVYWLAIQPSDCGEPDLWWPQRQSLSFERDGAWSVRGATLGRDLGDGGEDDVGATYTLAVFEVPREFAGTFKNDVAISRPADCAILYTVSIRRVEQ